MNENIDIQEIEKHVKNFEHFRAKAERISWHEYFFNLSYLVSERSPDAQTKHGAVIVDKNNRIISTGYNGFPYGGPDNILPNLRPAKYPYIIHAEMNALLSARCDVRDFSVYITGTPCKNCLLHLIGAGIRDIFAGEKSYVEDEESKIVKRILINTYGVRLYQHYPGDRSNILEIFPEKDQKGP